MHNPFDAAPINFIHIICSLHVQPSVLLPPFELKFHINAGGLCTCQVVMPLGSIAEWRARIGSSWCALGRPFKTRSPFRGGAGRLQTPLTLNQVVTTMVILIIFTAINLALRIVWTTGHYRTSLGEYLAPGKFPSDNYEKLLPELNALL